MREIPRLKCDLNFGLPVLSVLGIIYSMWSSNYFIAALDSVHIIFFGWRDDYFLEPMQKTYYLLNIFTSVMLYIGFKNSDKKLIRYWHVSKLVDSLFVFTGAVILASYRFYRYWPFVLVAIVLLGIGWYLVTTIQEGSKNMSIEIQPACTNENQENPPSYDAALKMQENLNEETHTLLRIYGFVKKFEIVAILPGTVLVIVNSETVNGFYIYYWNIFWYLTGLSLCYILCLKYIWTLIPKKVSSNLDINKETEVPT